MKIDVLTLFPEMFNNILNESIIKRAIQKGLVEINIINFRDYSPLNNCFVFKSTHIFGTLTSFSVFSPNSCNSNPP